MRSTPTEKMELSENPNKIHQVNSFSCIPPLKSQLNNIKIFTVIQYLTSRERDTVNNTNEYLFLTDAFSVLQVLENKKLDKPSEALHPISSINQVVLRWIPAHCGITRNENADRLLQLGVAKE